MAGARRSQNANNLSSFSYFFTGLTDSRNIFFTVKPIFQKSLWTNSSVFSSFGVAKGDFSLLRSKGGWTFCYIFGIYLKFGYKNPLILTLVDVAIYIAWVTSVYCFKKHQPVYFSSFCLLCIIHFLQSQAHYTKNFNCRSKT